MRGGQTWLLLLMVLVDRCQAVPPVISGFPSVYRVIAGDEVGIDCSTYTTDGVPPTTTYSWRSGAYRQDGPVLGRVVQRGMDSETYNCTASNTQGEATASVFVDILYGPWPPPRGSSERMMEFSNFGEDGRGGFTPGNPNVTSFVWTGPQNFTSNGSILYIQNITRSQRGTYTLTASNFLQPTNKPPVWAETYYYVHLDVYYPPNISGLQRSILLENVLNLNCSNYTTPGNPDFENTFMWSDEDGNNITGPILTLNSSFIGTRTKLRYTCYVSNLIGSDTAYVDVILVYSI
ncbi:uncharacterized protein LOC124146018 isoform X2 [Haliotis rufescens]|uniref:uncharacterized protein LOC124146018 isoform X2 n=1 Tax=Haliotis rufescens TaxID=6454 RepID=UPI00201ED0C9|nr:uncharacterized protein LOC124146018 isoform X2 [Haliotis rufescens]